MKSSTKVKSHKSDYAYWRKIMAEYEKQDLSQPDFCKQYQYDFRQFRYYRSRLSQIDKGIVVQKSKPNEPSIPFAPVIIKPENSKMDNVVNNNIHQASGNFTLEFSGGIRCTIPTNFDANSLRKLVAALR